MVVLGAGVVLNAGLLIFNGVGFKPKRPTSTWCFNAHAYFDMVSWLADVASAQLASPKCWYHIGSVSLEIAL